MTDGSVNFSYESSAALGSGFRCGFLGMLHLDVFRQRILDEHEIHAIITAPTVAYKCKVRNKPELVDINNPLESPPTEVIEYWEESIVAATIITPAEYAKEIRVLCEDKRGMMMS